MRFYYGQQPIDAQPGALVTVGSNGPVPSLLTLPVLSKRDTAAALGIAQTFTAIQTVNLSGFGAPVTTAGIANVGAAASNVTFQGQSYGGATLFLGYRTNGTPGGALTGVVASDNLFLLGGAGRTSSGAYTGSTGLIAIVATETYVAGTNQGADITFAVTPTASSARAEVARFKETALLIGATALVGTERFRVAAGGTPGTPGATDFLVGNGIAALGTQLNVGANKVVAARKTGWTAPTGTATRTGYATSTATLTQVAEALKALIDDLHSTAGHGLIGT